MTGFLIFLAALAIGCCIFGFIGLRIACVRQAEPDWTSPEAMAASHREKFAESNRKAAQWIESHQEEDWQLTSYDGLRLCANWCPAEDPKGTIVLFHGYRSSAVMDFSLILQFYHRLGFNLLLVNQRSHGKSEGKYITFGIRESRDAVSWMEEVNRRCGEDLPMFLGGMSMGSTTVQMALGRGVPRNVRGAVVDCGFTSPWDEMNHVVRRWMHVPGPLVLVPAWPFCKVFAGFGLKEYSTVDALKDNHVPILFIHGQADTFVPCWMSQKGYDVNPGEKDILLVPEANHGMSYLVDQPRCQSKLEDFIMSHLPKGAD